MATTKTEFRYSQLSVSEMNIIITDVKVAVSCWKTLATEIGIPRTEQEMMSSAFRY